MELEVQVRNDLYSHRLTHSPLLSGVTKEILQAGIQRVGVCESGHSSHTANLPDRTSIVPSFSIEPQTALGHGETVSRNSSRRYRSGKGGRGAINRLEFDDVRGAMTESRPRSRSTLG